MGSIYLPLDRILRDAGLVVVEYDGWEYESRSSGGWDNNPLCVMWHHTAGGGSDENSAIYMKENSDIAPVANIMPGHDGRIHLMAGGATNTNGSGRSRSFSRGTVPQDGMNTRAVGMEIHNNGVGEGYPQAQFDAAVAASNAINKYLGNTPSDIDLHQTYAPDRKVDPATVGAVPYVPVGPELTSSGTWNLDTLRGICQARWDGEPPPPSPSVKPGGDYDPPDNWGLFPLDCGKASLRKGDRSQLVWYLQDVIKRWSNPDITVDGSFGSDTERSVRDLQTVLGIISDGVVGWDGTDCNRAGADSTWTRIDNWVTGEAPEPPDPTEPPSSLKPGGDYDPPDNWGLFPFDCGKPTLRNGNRSQHVWYLQDVIKRWSNPDITVDGIFGNDTERSVKDLQKVLQIISDGVVGWDGGDCHSAGKNSTWWPIDNWVQTGNPYPF